MRNISPPTARVLLEMGFKLTGDVPGDELRTDVKFVHDDLYDFPHCFEPESKWVFSVRKRGDVPSLVLALVGL